MAGRLSCRRYLADAIGQSLLKFLSKETLKSLDVSIAELVSGNVNGLSNEAERTVFVFRSVVLGDLAALAYQKLCARGAEFSS